MIHVEDIAFLKGRDYPLHDDIFNDLVDKKTSNPTLVPKLHEAIKRVYDCEDPNDILPAYSKVKFLGGYSVELILKVIKWFLIEQDIRDWNYSGRAMFMDGVNRILL